MFSFKSIGLTNISANYTIAPTSASTAGPWKIYDAKKKSTGKAYSVFVFDKKSLDTHSLSRSGAAALKKAADEVVERLRKEASALAKLRHPSILELVEPVEDTRGGGLQFVTEAVTASLAGLLRDKDAQERAGGVGGRASRYVTEEPDGTRRRRELEIDELEIQKGLLQVSRALDFLHDNAGLVHGNLTPDAILVNAKSDWKISGLAFCTPPENSSKPTSIAPVNLYEILHTDTRLPPAVQLSLDYTSPDFVLDNNLTTSADMFSLGLVCIALYNSPHRSPLDCCSSLSGYKRLFQSSSSSALPSAANGFLSSRPLPRDLLHHVLPRLVARRPAQRMTAKEFQQSEYFDNILVSTIRFLDSFPAKTPGEKTQFLRGLVRVLPSFPKSVMEKKILPALLEEMKDRDLVSLILHNVFKIVELLPSGRRAFSDKIRPALKDIFVVNAKAQERDAARDAGLMIVLEQLPVISSNCSGKEFKDDILPIVFVTLESPTPSIVDAALRGLPIILPVLDFSTIKNELFPVVAAIFTKTNSLAIKVRGLQAFVVLCGGSDDDDGLDGLTPKSSSSALDKYTMQEKIVPLVKLIKTKEPAVMMAALRVLRVVGRVADADFVAMDILPVLWHMSLGPLLDLKQFRSFMDLIRTLSARVEEEQTRKLQELAGNANGSTLPVTDDFMSFGAAPSSGLETSGSDDFERLVKGGDGATTTNPMDNSWDTYAPPPATTGTLPSVASPAPKPTTPAFSWSTPSPPVAQAQPPAFRTVTPDLAQFAALTPSATQFSRPLQPAPATETSTVSWGANPWKSNSSTAPATTSTITPSLGQPGQSGSSFSLQPPDKPAAPAAPGFSLAPPPAPSQGSSLPANTGGPWGSSLGAGSGTSMNSMRNMGGMPRPQQPQKSGLDKYESLL